MQHDLAAARRFLAMGLDHPRARSIINAMRPIFRYDAVDADRAAALKALAEARGPKIARLEVSLNGQFVPLATAWPCASGLDPDAPGPTRRFVTAGHVLPLFFQTAQILSFAGSVQTRAMRPGRVVFPDGRTFEIRTWISAHDLDLAVFDIEGQCEGLILDRSGNLPTVVAPIGYPLVAGVGLFAQIDAAYREKLFAGTGDSQPHSSRRLKGYFLHDATTIPGYSGAPVFDPATQRVVGVHVWGSADRPDVAEGSPEADPFAADLNDAVRISAALGDGWMRDILAGLSDTPPDGAPTRPWEARQSPEAALSLSALGQEALRRIAPARRPVAPPDAGIDRDRADSRDRWFRPSLAPPAQQILPQPTVIGDQATEGSCAAFAVAAAIEHHLAQRPDHVAAPVFRASVRMLDRMARRHDEWLDDKPDGTSLRAVLKGFYHNGVCSWDRAPYVPGLTDFFLTRDIAKEARRLTLGSYLRVRATLDDMRMAVQEARVVIVTARIHDGWRHPDADHRIPYDPADPPQPRGLHAFVIDGYTDEGFIVQNSRGPDWGGFAGLPGHALWSFDDWAAHCGDAWVIRLAPDSARAFAVAAGGHAGAGTRRIGLLGHMIHAERGGLIEEGTLGLGARGVAETAGYLASDEGRAAYPRLLLMVHDPLLDGDTIAGLALPLTMRLKARGIYPLHIVYGMDEMLGCRLRLAHDVGQAVARYLREEGSRDAALARQLGPGIRAQVDSYRRGAQEAAPRLMRDALAVLPTFAADEGRRVQIVSVGLGAIPARALGRAVPDFRPDHLSIAPPVPLRGARVWRLSNERDESDLPGWHGSLGDLIAAANGCRIRARGGSPAVTTQALLGQRDFVTQMVDRLS